MLVIAIEVFYDMYTSFQLIKTIVYLLRGDLLDSYDISLFHLH
jgi:hypothetical protein